MEYEKGIDGSYVHNCIVVCRKDDPTPTLFYSKTGSSISAFLNGYAVIPIKEYCELKGIEYNGSKIEEADKVLHNKEK